MIVIDATGHVAGRLATAVAKKLLQGETVVIVNAELAIVSGDRWTVLEHYEVKRYKGDVRSGPFFPRRADLAAHVHDKSSRVAGNRRPLLKPCLIYQVE